jgi:peptidylprolyl isomerase
MLTPGDVIPMYSLLFEGITLPPSFEGVKHFLRNCCRPVARQKYTCKVQTNYKENYVRVLNIIGREIKSEILLRRCHRISDLILTFHHHQSVVIPIPTIQLTIQPLIMKLYSILVSLALIGSTAAFSLSMSVANENVDRRAFIRFTGAAAAATAVNTGFIQPARAADDPYADFVTTESGLKYKVTKDSDGAIPSPGATVKAHYTGWLGDFDSEKKFDSSRDRGRPFTFKVGAGQVIRGWDESFGTMKVGERRQIIIPPRLGYGDRGAGGIIPGGATLYFDVELLAVM